MGGGAGKFKRKKITIFDLWLEIHICGKISYKQIFHCAKSAFLTSTLLTAQLYMLVLLMVSPVSLERSNSHN